MLKLCSLSKNLAEVRNHVHGGKPTLRPSLRQSGVPLFQAGGAIAADAAEATLKLTMSCLADNEVVLFLVSLPWKLPWNLLSVLQAGA